MKRPQLVLMGRASGAFGLKGELRVSSYARDPQVFFRSSTIYAGPNEESARPYTVVSLKAKGGKIRLRTREIGTREEAERLQGFLLFVKPEALTPLEDGEYYWFDLKNTPVRTEEGLSLGLVKQVWDSGAHDLLLVQNEKGQEALIPVVEGVVLKVDTSLRCITVRLPPGLLGAQGWDEPQGPAAGTPGQRRKKAKPPKARRRFKNNRAKGPQTVGEKEHDL